MASAGSASRRRVLIIVQNASVPHDRRVWLEATTLQRAGYEVSVVCPRSIELTRRHEVLEGVHIYRYPLPIDAQGSLGFVAEYAWCSVATLLNVWRVARRGPGFDVIQVCNPPETFFPLGWFCRATGRGFAFDHHDLSPEMYDAKFDRPNPVLRRVLVWLERQTFRAANVVITTNDSHAEIARTRGGIDDEDIFIVRSGPDVDRWTRYPVDPQWRAGTTHQLVYLGEICRQDGVDHLVRALRELRDRHRRDDVHCMFVGAGPHQPAIKAYADEIGVGDLCTFTGRVSDDVLCRILSSADVAIDPDPKTPWSDRSTMNKIMDYMFFGLPIVAYDLREHRVSAKDAAVYATPNDESALADEIAALLDDPGRRAELGRAGRHRLESALAWQHSEPQLLAAYDRMFGSRRSSPATLQ